MYIRITGRIITNAFIVQSYNAYGNPPDSIYHRPSFRIVVLFFFFFFFSSQTHPRSSIRRNQEHPRSWCH